MVGLSYEQLQTLARVSAIGLCTIKARGDQFEVTLLTCNNTHVTLMDQREPVRFANPLDAMTGLLAMGVTTASLDMTEWNPNQAEDDRLAAQAEKARKAEERKAKEEKRKAKAAQRAQLRRAQEKKDREQKTARARAAKVEAARLAAQAAIEAQTRKNPGHIDWVAACIQKVADTPCEPIDHDTLMEELRRDFAPQEVQA